MTSSWSYELNIGNFLRFYNTANNLIWSFQNFYIASTVTWDNGDQDNDGDVDYSFLPFGFSGLATSQDGGLEPATLIFPNDQAGIARGYLSEALRGKPLRSEAEATGVITPYVAEVDVCIINQRQVPDDKMITAPTVLVTYTGQCTGGGWGDTTLNMQLSSLLDAATPDIPTRTLHQKLVGNLPFSANVRLR